MFQRLHPPEPDPKIRVSPYRLTVAFTVAAVVACVLFITASWILVTDGHFPPPVMVLIILLIYAVPITIVISFALYLVLERLNRLSVWTIVPLAFLQGVAMACVFFGLGSSDGSMDAGMGLWVSVTGLLSVGFCALIGGIVFCWLTIWHRPMAGGGRDV